MYSYCLQSDSWLRASLPNPEDQPLPISERIHFMYARAPTAKGCAGDLNVLIGTPPWNMNPR